MRKFDNQIIRVADMGEAAIQAALYGDEGYELVAVTAIDYSLIYLSFRKDVTPEDVIEVDTSPAQETLDVQTQAERPATDEDNAEPVQPTRRTRR